MKIKFLLIITALSALTAHAMEKRGTKRTADEAALEDREDASKRPRVDATPALTPQEKNTVLAQAIEQGYEKKVAEALAHGPKSSDVERPSEKAQKIEPAQPESPKIDINEFIAYVRNGNAESVKESLRMQPELTNATINTKITPLYIAAASGHEEIVNLLIISGAEVNFSTKEGETPLYAAAKAGHNAIVKRLIAANAYIDRVSSTGRVPLFIAAQNGNMEVVKTLIDARANVNQEQCVTGNATPLYVAMQNGHIAVAQMLISAGADVNKVLSVAAPMGPATVVQAVIAAGADVNKVSGDGSTPLYAACRAHNIPVIRTLLGVPSIARNFNNATYFLPETRLILNNDESGNSKKLFEAIRNNNFDEVLQVIEAMQQKVFVYDRWGINQQVSQESKEAKENFELYNTPLHVALKNYAALQNLEEKRMCLLIIRALSNADTRLWYIPNKNSLTPLNIVLQKHIFEDIRPIAPTKYYNAILKTLTSESQSVVLPEDVVANIVQEYMCLTEDEAENRNLLLSQLIPLKD